MKHLWWWLVSGLFLGQGAAAQTLTLAPQTTLVGVWTLARPQGASQQWTLVRFAEDSTMKVVARTVDEEGTHEEPLLPIRTGRWAVVADPWSTEQLLCVKRDPPPTPVAVELHWAPVLCHPYRLLEQEGGQVWLQWNMDTLLPATPEVLEHVGLPDF